MTEKSRQVYLDDIAGESLWGIPLKDYGTLDVEVTRRATWKTGNAWEGASTMLHSRGYQCTDYRIKYGPDQPVGRVYELKKMITDSVQLRDQLREVDWLPQNRTYERTENEPFKGVFGFLRGFQTPELRLTLPYEMGTYPFINRYEYRISIKPVKK